MAFIIFKTAAKSGAPKIRIMQTCNLNLHNFIHTRGYCKTKSLLTKMRYIQNSERQLEKTQESVNVLRSTTMKINKPIFDILYEVAPRKASNQSWLNQKRNGKHAKVTEDILNVMRYINLKTRPKSLDSPIHFPYKIDSHGRVNPANPDFHPFASDALSALFHFDKKKRLGLYGWSHLMGHAAYLLGCNATSLEERERYTMNNIDKILDSVDNPLTGKRFWFESSNPFQCLATFHEIVAAYRSGNPKSHMSSLPIFRHDPYLKFQHSKVLKGGLEGVRYKPSSAMLPNIRNKYIGFPATKLYDPLLSSHMARVTVSSYKHEIPILFEDDIYATYACDIEPLKLILTDEFYNTYNCRSLTKSMLLGKYKSYVSVVL